LCFNSQPSKFKRFETESQQIATLNERAARFELESLQIRQKNLELEQKNHELEVAISPRGMEQANFAEKLRKLSGINVILTVVGDMEAIRTAGKLQVVLSGAGWKVTKKIVSDYERAILIRDGITVARNVGALPKDDYSKDATQLVIEGLEENHIQVTWMPSISSLPILLKFKLDSNLVFPVRQRAR
jgi:hypothetical protein